MLSYYRLFSSCSRSSLLDSSIVPWHLFYEIRSAFLLLLIEMSLVFCKCHHVINILFFFLVAEVPFRGLELHILFMQILWDGWWGCMSDGWEWCCCPTCSTGMLFVWGEMYWLNPLSGLMYFCSFLFHRAEFSSIYCYLIDVQLIDLLLQITTPVFLLRTL